jgi:hypothetical protein
MQVLKAVVVLLGIVIVAASSFIAYTIYKRGPGTASVPQYAEDNLSFPKDARIVSVNGSGDVLSLLVEFGDGRQEIVTVNRRTGAVLGRLTVQVAP